MNEQAPKQLFVQLTANGGTVSYLIDPRKVHDNGKSVYTYRLAGGTATPTTVVQNLIECLETTIEIQCSRCGDGQFAENTKPKAAAKELAALGWTCGNEGYAICPRCARVARATGESATTEQE